MSDAEVIHRLMAGDSGELEMLVVRYQARAIKATFLILHNEQLAEDIVQDTFVLLYSLFRCIRETDF